MKTKSTAFILFLFIVFAAQAQPEKGTWQIGGSGNWIKTKNDGELKYKTYNLDAEVSYFVLKNLALGSDINLVGYKDYTKVNDPNIYGFYFAPALEAYVINHKTFGVSVKGSINFLVSSSKYWAFTNKKMTSYMFGPKVAWNITSNLSTYLWAAYRKYDDFDMTKGFKNIIPSDNFDIRWGFSYFLHRKKQ